jgi:hypothetical protein
MSERRKLTDILRDRDTIAAAWDRTEAAADLGPLPAGVYAAEIVGGSLFTAATGTAGFKIAFRVTDGDHAGRRF